MPDTVYFRLGRLLPASGWPVLGILPDSIRDLWISQPTYDVASSTGRVGLLLDVETVLRIPGIDFLSLSIGPNTSVTPLDLELQLSPFAIRLRQAEVVLRIDAEILRPIKEGTTAEPDTSKKTLDITLGRIDFTINGDGDLDFQFSGAASLPRCMIGSTGVIIEIGALSWLSPSSGTKPPNTPAGFTGLYLDDVKAEVVGLPIATGVLSMDDVFIGTGGFSGRIAWDDPSLKWETDKFTGILVGDISGFKGGLSHIAVELRQNSFVECEITGDVFVPYLDKRIGLSLGLDGAGGFTAAAGLPVSSPADPGVAAGKPGYLLHVDVGDFLSFDIDALRFSLPAGRKPVLEISGGVELTIDGLDAPPFDFKGLRIDGDGNVAIDGGWIDLSNAKIAPFHGFPLEITKLGFGAEDSGRQWIGLNGGLKLADGLPIGASVEGLRISWDPKAGNAAAILRSVGVSLDGVGLQLRIEGTLEFDGAVAFFNDAATGNRGFRGHIHLNIVSVKLVVDARIVVGRTPAGDTFFYLYLGVDLPAGIPCFSTGLSFYGFAGLIAVNMRPNRSPDEDWYYGWYLRSPTGVTDERKWAVEPDAFAGGVGTTIGTATDDGFAFSCKMLLVLLLPGPQFLLSGKGSFIKTRPDSTEAAAEGAFEFLVVLDIPAKLFQGNLAVTYRVPDLLEIGGGSEVKFSWAPTPPPDVWHLYVGEKTPMSRRIQAVLLEILRANAYFQLTKSGIELGVWIGVSEDYRYGPARAWFTASVQGEGAVSWKPQNFSTSLRMTGDAGIAAFGVKVHIVLDSGVAAKGPEPWYISMYIHLAIEIDLWFVEWSFDVTLPLSWGDENSPLPLPAEPVVQLLAAEHLKADESFALDSGPTLTIPADARPVVVFQRPVQDRASIGNPNTPNVPGDRVGPRTFSYQLLHVALVRKIPGNRVLAAAGLVDVSGSSATLFGGQAARPALPGVVGAILQLPDIDATLSVTDFESGTLSLSGSAEGGLHPYRLYAAPARTDIQINEVWEGAYSSASLVLASSSGAKDAFVGGTLIKGSASWLVMGNDGTAVIVRVTGPLPTAGQAQLVGAMGPTLEGQWLPVDDREDATTPSPTTKLMLWARSPFAWFRRNDEETLRGFGRNNPDWACGPKPEHTPICYKFGDFTPGTLEGSFVTEDLHGIADHGIEVKASGPDGVDRWLALGSASLTGQGSGRIEFTFDPLIERLIVRYRTTSKGRSIVSAYHNDEVVATVSPDPEAAEVTLSGQIDRVEIISSYLLISDICVFPGWSCIRFDEETFPEEATSRVFYSQLLLESTGKMRVEDNVLIVGPAASNGDERRGARGIIVVGYAPKQFDPTTPRDPGWTDPVPEMSNRFVGGWSYRSTPPYFGMEGVTTPYDGFIPGLGHAIIGPVGGDPEDFGGPGGRGGPGPGGGMPPEPDPPQPQPVPDPVDPMQWIEEVGRPIVVKVGGPVILVASVAIILPAPTVRARVTLGGPGQIVAFAGVEEVARAVLEAPGTAELRPVDNYLDRLVITNLLIVRVVEVCFDRTPTGLTWADRSAWQESIKRSIDWLYREDALLAPGLYSLEITTSIVAGGTSSFERWYSKTVNFTVGQPPGVTLPSGNAETDKRYPRGGPLNQLATYVDFTIPGPGERPFYRAYDVGVSFNEPYVSRMFLAAGKPLSVAVVDSNDRDLRRDSRNHWGSGPVLELSTEERYSVGTFNSDDEQCVAVDLSQIPHSETVSAGAGELLAAAELHAGELRAQGVTTHPVYRFEFVTSQFADFVHHLSTHDRSCRTQPVPGSAPANLAALIGAVDVALQALAAAVSGYELAKTAATTGSPTSDQFRAFDDARALVKVARTDLASARTNAFDTTWQSHHQAPPASTLPSNVEVLSVVPTTGASPQTLLRIDSPEPIRWSRTALLELSRTGAIPLRRSLITFDRQEFGAPDIGTFRFRSMTWTTDAELRVRDNALESRVAGSWRLEITTVRVTAVAVTLSVTNAGGSATLHADGVGASPDVTQNQTEGDTTAELIITGSDLRAIVLQSSGTVRIHAIAITEWHRPVPAQGPLRFVTAVLPSDSGPDDHYVEVVAYKDVDLDGWSVRWFDALSPTDPKSYHVVTSSAELLDGKKARIYGSRVSAAVIAGMQVLGGGAVGPLPSTGVVFELVDPAGNVVHELTSMPSSGFVPLPNPVVMAKEDETRTLLLPRTGTIEPGHWRLRLQMLRDAGPELPVLSVGGNTGAEMMELAFTVF